MKDIDMFTTEYGVASLILKEIPYRREAYILIRETAQLKALLAECIKFCNMCGAERIYAAGDFDLEEYPIHTTIIRMCGTAAAAQAACLWPVTSENVSQWRRIYNEKMASVDNAATLTAVDEKRILDDGGAYFVHNGAEMLGIGWLSGTELLALAAVKRGAGGAVLQTMLSLAAGETVRLEVASTNLRALELYKKHGFIALEEVRKWYCVQP